MRMLFKILGFIFSWISIFVIVYVNHIALADEQFDVDLFGLLLVMGGLIGIIKWVDNKCKVYEIQDKNKMFRVNWNNGKRVIMIISFTWILFTIEDNLPKMQLSALLITFSFIIGYVFTILGNIKKSIKKEDTTIK